MRFVMIIICLIFASFFLFTEREKILMDKEIYGMYENGFENYLIKNENILVLDENKIENELKGKGYNAICIKDNNSFQIIVQYRFILKREKKYSFLMVINNEVE